MHDVAVVGLGVMGSAVAYHLARRGLRVLGVERFASSHDRGSSHGRTRVIRQAYFEHPDYVPLVRRAWEGWRSLECETGQELLRRTGVLMIGSPESSVVRGSLESARVHALPHRRLSSTELRTEFPALRVRPTDVAVHEEEAGILFAEECVAAFQGRARELGAELRFGVRVEPGERPAPRLVVATGPWMGEWASELLLDVERQVVHWFDPVEIPLLVWDYEGRPFYGLPDVRGDGVKVAFHHGGERTLSDRVRREVDAAEIEEMRSHLGKTIPVLVGFRRAATCLYTNTPDGHFAVGWNSPDMLVVSACSGHGFKFAPVVGEIVADLVESGTTRWPLDLFRLDRFR